MKISNLDFNHFILDVDLKESCSPVILEGMERPCPAIPNGTGGFFVLLDKDPLSLPAVKNYRSITIEETIESRARYLAFKAGKAVAV